MKGALYAPARGDVVWLQCTPQAGREQSGRRPAVIVSPVVPSRRIAALPPALVGEIQARIMALIR